MLIPYSTDAPLYHAPFATIGLIIINTVLFIPIFVERDAYRMGDDEDEYEQTWSEDEADFAQNEFPETDDGFDSPVSQADREKVFQELEKHRQRKMREAGEDGSTPKAKRKQGTSPWRLLTLEFGKFRPWQWLTANYMHADTFHLLGNMFVLWGFGLVVEGKIGWWKFLLAYNFIGIAGWGLVQMLMLFASEGIGLGASLPIFGILAMALIWAPANEMQCLFFLFIRPIAFEASILTIAMFSVGLQIAISIFHVAIVASLGMGVGMLITSEVLHLIGAFFGFGVGIIMLQRNLVDCENWDVFSVWAGKNQKTIQQDREDVAGEIERIKDQERRQIASRNAPVVQPQAADTQQRILISQFQSLVQTNQGIAAWMTYQRGMYQFPYFRVPEPDLVNCITLLRKEQQWETAAEAMQIYLQGYTEREILMRLALAQLYLQHLNRPKDSVQLLSSINEAFLDPNQKTMYDKLKAAIRQRQAAAATAAKPKPPPQGWRTEE